MRGARRPLAVGLGLAGVYVLAAVATLVLSDRPFRPLFDGLAPPLPYRWVNPPREVARDNQKPAAARREAPLGPEGSPFVNVTPDDGQAILLLEDKAVPPHPPDTAVAAAVSPHDALTLGPLPDDMSPQSNAYRVEVTYRPSGGPVTAFQGTTSSIALVGAGASDALLYSPDGQAWAARPTTPLGSGHGLETPLAGTGYYLVVDIDDSGGAQGTSPAMVALVVGIPPLLLAGLVVRNRRAKAAAAAAEAKAASRKARPRPGGRKSKRRRRRPGRRGRRRG
jgi:hypothetical protein